MMYRLSFTVNQPNIPELHGTRRELWFHTNYAFVAIKFWQQHPGVTDVRLERLVCGELEGVKP